MLVWSPALLHQGSLLCAHFSAFYKTLKIKFLFTFISELIEENKESKESDEVEEKNHVKTGEKPLSCSQTKQKDLKKRRDKKSFNCSVSTEQSG